MPSVSDLLSEICRCVAKTVELAHDLIVIKMNEAAQVVHAASALFICL